MVGMMQYFIAGSVTFLLVAGIIPCIISLAQRFNILDIPDGKIKCHQKAVPYLGGIALGLGFFISSFIFFPYSWSWFLTMLGLFILLIIGLIDDLICLTPFQKFLWQGLAVFLFLMSGAFFVLTIPHWLALIFSGFWIFSIINACNLVDVMDGLLSVIACSAAGVFFYYAYSMGIHDLCFLLAIFIGACCGFFVFNAPPAKIYLGDAGSLFIGGFLSIIPLFIAKIAPLFYNLPCAHYILGFPYAFMVILAVPSLEIFSLIIIRSYLGIPFYRGSPHHFSIFLQKKGWTRWGVLAFTTAIALLFSLVSIGHACGFLSCALFLGFFSMLIVLWGLIVFR